ncbi:MAG: Rid family detoxifying hydrolase [Desulfobulbaceae bacterium]|nr:Rid family detoxifying hydrolase [Desulfobulbaceae bacterium]
MRKIIATSEAPAAIGPYSQAVVRRNLLFISGQLPIDPESGALVTDNISGQTRRIMENIQAIASEAGTRLEKAVKSTIFLTDLRDFQAMNAAYGEYFPANPPARSTVQVAALPLNSPIGIEMIIAV